MRIATAPQRQRVAQAVPGTRPVRWLARADQVSLGVLSLTLLGALGVYAYRGWFSRYTADDYCTAGLERAAGFVGSQIYWYEFWSGRMTYYFVVDLVEFAGPTAAQVLPAIAIFVWLCLGAWAVLPVARQQRWPVPLGSAAVASAAVILVCLSGAPRLDQSLYWMTGMLTYLLPLVLMTAYAGWLARHALGAAGSRRVSRREMFASGAGLVLVGGLSEVSLAVQLALLGLATCCALVLLTSERYQGLRMLLVSAVIATVVSAVIVVGAPGNRVHEATVTGTVHPLSDLPFAFRSSVDFVGLFARAVEFRARPAVLLLLVLTFGWGFSARAAENPHRRRRWYWYAVALAATLGCGWLVLIAGSVPGYFAQQWDVPERAQFVSVWIVALTLGTVGYLLGLAAGEATQRFGPWGHESVWRAVWAAALLVAALAPLPSARDTLALVPADAAYAADWDSLDATLSADAATGGPAVLDRTLPPHFGFEFLGSDPNLYPNPCVSRFYGLPSLTVSQPG